MGENKRLIAPGEKHKTNIREKTKRLTAPGEKHKTYERKQKVDCIRRKNMT